MSLRRKQSLFAVNVALLILEAKYRGFEVTLGDAFRDPRTYGHIGTKKGYGHKDSLHKSRLAIDLNLFDHLGRYIIDAEGHAELHLWWHKQGGNPMIQTDPNHYSWPHGEMK